MKTFTIKKNHLKLLQKAYVDWDDCEFGAPEINPKRPYGNSSVVDDIAEILGWQVGEEITEEQYELARIIHKETQVALQICLVMQKFEEGDYTQCDKYNSRTWQRIK